MVNYQNSKIYKLVSKNTGSTYIGSTCTPLNLRLNKHRSDFHNCPDKSMTSKICFRDGEVGIFLIEDYPCNNKKELHEREKYFIKNMECVNKNIPNRSRHEWYIDNRDKVLSYKAEVIVCECGKKATRSHIQRHKKSNIHKKLLQEKTTNYISI